MFLFFFFFFFFVFISLIWFYIRIHRAVHIYSLCSIHQRLRTPYISLVMYVPRWKMFLLLFVE